MLEKIWYVLSSWAWNSSEISSLFLSVDKYTWCVTYTIFIHIYAEKTTCQSRGIFPKIDNNLFSCLFHNEVDIIYQNGIPATFEYMEYLENFWHGCQKRWWIAYGYKNVFNFFLCTTYDFIRCFYFFSRVVTAGKWEQRKHD